MSNFASGAVSSTFGTAAAAKEYLLICNFGVWLTTNPGL